MSTKLSVKLIIIIVIGLLLVLLPGMLRKDNIRLGSESYFYERIFDLTKNNIVSYDPLSNSGRDFNYNVGPVYTTLILGKIFSLGFVLKFIPLILYIITIILIYLLIKRFYLAENEIYLILILLIISPMMMYVFSSYNLFTLTIPLITLSCYFFTKKEKIYYYSSLFILFLSNFFDYKASLTILSFILIYTSKEKSIKKFYLPLVIFLLSLVISYLPRIIKYGFSTNVIKENYFSLLISDLGGLYGYSIFLIFFIFFGLNYLWGEKYKNLHLYASFLLAIILSLLNKNFIIYSIVLFSYLAFLGINYLFKSKWESESIRRLTIFLLIIGLIFSSYSSFINIKNSQPNKELYDILNELKNIGSPDNVVFSHYSYGILINTISNKKNYLDEKIGYLPNFRQKYEDMQAIFNSRNADQTKNLLDKYKVRYILITKEMKEGLIWSRGDEGLLFVIQNTKEFKRIYNNDYAEIWRIR